MNLILLGAPGSGKGTQAAKLVIAYGFKQLSTGDIFRQNIAQKTDLGRLAEQYMNQGQLVPDDVTNRLVAKQLHHQHQNLIFDGYPRTIAQAEALTQMLTQLHTKVDYVLYLDVPERLLIKRISGRLICPHCKRSFQRHDFHHQPLICPYDGTKLIRRPDDAPAKVRTRLRAYYQETAPLIDYYRHQRLLITIKEKPNETSDDVFARIVEATKLND